LADERRVSGIAGEDGAFIGVCIPDADDFDDAMVFGVCHEINGGTDHQVSPNDCTADQRLESVASRLAVFDVNPFVYSGPVNQFGGGEPGTVGIV
jgi:hypothetical protein